MPEVPENLIGFYAIAMPGQETDSEHRDEHELSMIHRL